MSKEIRKYNSDFKFKVVMKYLSENYTTYQICSEYDIAKSTLHKWVKQFKASSYDIFSDAKLSKEEKLNKKEQKKKDKEIDKFLSKKYPTLHKIKKKFVRKMGSTSDQ